MIISNRKADIALIGLAVMGQNLILNMDSRGFVVCAYNRTVDKVSGVYLVFHTLISAVHAALIKMSIASSCLVHNATAWFLTILWSHFNIKFLREFFFKSFRSHISWIMKLKERTSLAQHHCKIWSANWKLHEKLCFWLKVCCIHHKSQQIFIVSFDSWTFVQWNYNST